MKQRGGDRGVSGCFCFQVWSSTRLEFIGGHRPNCVMVAIAKRVDVARKELIDAVAEEKRRPR